MLVEFVVVPDDFEVVVPVEFVVVVPDDFVVVVPVDFVTVVPVDFVAVVPVDFAEVVPVDFAEVVPVDFVVVRLAAFLRAEASFVTVAFVFPSSFTDSLICTGFFVTVEVVVSGVYPDDPLLLAGRDACFLCYLHKEIVEGVFHLV